jgi:hypothetical protein
MPTLELEAMIDHRREIHLQLPADAKEGPARVVVRYEVAEPSSAAGNLDDFLDALPRNPAGRNHGDILRQVREEREAWGDEA